MINIDFSLAISIYFVIFIGIILLIWMLSRKEKNRDLSLDPKFIWFCSICTYTYVNTREEVISICPRCGNYNKK
ncbi:MAG: hypothetical protein ABIH18_03515 [Candidatus Omnitrophota bacterium]